MSEFMGLIRGVYDAKADGFLPGTLCCAAIAHSARRRPQPHVRPARRRPPPILPPTTSTGGASLHLCMTPHGADATSYEAAVGAGDTPSHLPRDTLAFMFETHLTPRLMPHALGAPNIGE